LWSRRRLEVITNKGKLKAPIVISTAEPWAGIVASMAPIKLLREQILPIKPRTKLVRRILRNKASTYTLSFMEKNR
jgi:hypothetical protein